MRSVAGAHERIRETAFFGHRDSLFLQPEGDILDRLFRARQMRAGLPTARWVPSKRLVSPQIPGAFEALEQPKSETWKGWLCCHGLRRQRRRASTLGKLQPERERSYSITCKSIISKLWSLGMFGFVFGSKRFPLERGKDVAVGLAKSSVWERGVAKRKWNAEQKDPPSRTDSTGKDLARLRPSSSKPWARLRPTPMPWREVCGCLPVDVGDKGITGKNALMQGKRRMPRAINPRRGR